jgi:hypothetical protein
MDRRNLYRGLMGNPEGKKPLRRHRYSWTDNTEMDFRGM